MVLLSMSLMIADVEQLFVCWPFVSLPLEKCLQVLCPLFDHIICLFCYWVVYILTPYQIHGLLIFSPICRLPTLLVSFAVQELSHVCGTWTQLPYPWLLKFITGLCLGCTISCMITTQVKNKILKIFLKTIGKGITFEHLHWILNQNTLHLL